MYGYIYETTNLINGKKYIGRKTSNVFLGNNYLGSGMHLNKAISKHGRENFSVRLLEECYTSTQLIIHEYLWIKKLNAVEDPNYYNHSPGGLHEGFIPGKNNIAKDLYVRQINSAKHLGKKMSDEFKLIQSKLHLGKPSGMLGHKQSETHR